MRKRIIAHCIHHTHWDPFWYFTTQDSMVVFSYNIKEMLRAFENNEIQDFFLDGQTAAIDEYIEVHPEDELQIRKLVEADKLIIGPFVSQLDSFLCSGESVINNLRLGIKHAEKLGKSSHIAYLADPFGHSIDYPKIFNQFRIQDFVFTRGVGDIYDLGNEFYFESNDGSKVLCHTMLSGYGYGTYAFMNKSLFTSKAEDYNKINVDALIKRLIERSTLPNEFVFPLGFDQNPIMLHIQELISYYNQNNTDVEFRYTNWKDYFSRVRKYGKGLKTFRSEINSPQYHRLHLSGMNSARSDIKTIIDKAERSLTYETQPLMSMLDALGIPYDQGIIDKSWYALVNCQTHASATHVDDTNRWVKENALAALNYSEAAKVYLMRLAACSLPVSPSAATALIVFNTIPWKKDIVARMTIVSKKPDFQLMYHDDPIEFSVLNQEKDYGGVIRKDKNLMNEDKWFYKTEIVANVGSFDGISYKTFTVKEISESEAASKTDKENMQTISNSYYQIEHTSAGINIVDKRLGKLLDSVIFLQDGGDEGDSYDYSYPDDEDEFIITNLLSDAETNCIQTPDFASMTLKGTMLIPKSLEERAKKQVSIPLDYSLTFELNSTLPIIRIYGSILNQAIDHRVRLGIKTGLKNRCSYAGTQFSYAQRPCDPVEMKNWKQNGYFEEPCSTRPLLNHVSAVGEDYTLTVFTRSLKEYEFTDEDFSNIQLTLFRSVGYVGLPDLNRRPGRPSGLANKIFASPQHQMLGENTFDIGLCFYSKFDNNQIMRDYAEFATEPMYYQNQNIDKTIYPISYFPINPLNFYLPDEFRFLTIENFTGSYGTVKRAEKEDGYILQIYNSDQISIKGGELKLGFDCKQSIHVNLLEEKISLSTRNPIILKKGQLENILLITNQKGGTD